MSNMPLRVFDSGNGPTKSIPIYCHGCRGTGNVCNKPIGFWLLGFVVEHVMQVLQYASTSSTMVFHQTSCLKKSSVFREPKCASRECACLIIISRTLR